jgi:hypothetical protein
MLVFGVVDTAGLSRTAAGRLLKRAAVVQDLAASVAAFLLFRTLAPNPRFPLPILAGLVFSSVVLLRMFLPEVVTFFFARFEERGGDEHESRLRLVIALFLLVIFAYSLLDVHPIVAAFLVGFSLAEVPSAPLIRERLDTMGYGLFIPIFLFILGLDTDLRVITRLDPGSALAISVPRWRGGQQSPQRHRWRAVGRPREPGRLDCRGGVKRQAGCSADRHVRRVVRWRSPSCRSFTPSPSCCSSASDSSTSSGRIGTSAGARVPWL